METRHRIDDCILPQPRGESVNIFLTMSTFDQFHSFGQTFFDRSENVVANQTGCDYN